MAAAALLSGCRMHYPFMQEVYSVDYRAAGLDGKVFLTESNSVGFDYTPISSISIYERSGQVKSEKQEREQEKKAKKPKPKWDEIYGDWDRSDSGKKSLKGWRDCSYQSALEKASRTAVDMGGDAIINLKMEYVPTFDKDNTKIGSVYVTGMVVKRK